MEDAVVVLELLVSFGFPALALLIAYLLGAHYEKKHFKSILRRESLHRSFPVVSFDTMPHEWHASSGQLVAGNVVVSADYFKRFIARLRAFVGGRIKSYEPLLDRARREALLRMIESAREQGYDAIFNVRLETARLANGRDGQGTAGVEMLAFGTAVKLEDS
jgi:uncharacterized protein YbjQ (UPF0145 family)